MKPAPPGTRMRCMLRPSRDCNRSAREGRPARFVLHGKEFSSHPPVRYALAPPARVEALVLPFPAVSKPDRTPFKTLASQDWERFLDMAIATQAGPPSEAATR